MERVDKEISSPSISLNQEEKLMGHWRSLEGIHNKHVREERMDGGSRSSNLL